MASGGLSGLLPYAVNFSAVVAIVAVAARKPVQRFVFQRHERIKDLVEDSARAHRRATERVAAAHGALARLEEEAKRIKAGDVDSARKEAQEILLKAENEAARVRTEAGRLMTVEAAEAEARVRNQFLDRVISRVETKIQGGLRTDDHAQIVRRARSSIEVGI